VTARAGITIEDGLTGDNVLPITNAKATVSWMSSETASASPSTPTLSATTMQPKVAIGVIQASRHLIKQARDPERYIRRELLNTAGSVVDAAVLNGSGASGQPTGILNTESLLTQTGTTLQHAGVTSMKQKCATANVDDERIVFLSTPGIRELLENRLRTGNGSRYVWDEDKLADRPAFVSTDMPAATMLAGDFSNVWLGLWGSGIVIETNPYDPTLFKTGVLQLRVIVSMDVALGCSPSAFVKATSIT
jgi:HK97 family phage major capsid protein